VTWLKVIDATQLETFNRGRMLAFSADASLRASVEVMLTEVRNLGDAALLKYARQFDSPEVAQVLATDQEIAEASVPQEHENAIRLAIDRVREFHESQKKRLMEGWKPANGCLEWMEDGVGQRWRPLDSVGVYVPGGLASYPSSVIMNAVPAQVAGVRRVVVATPAQKSGFLSAAVGVALRLCGIHEVLKVGGAAAIGGFAFGTESIAPVDKIVGPGNRWVNEAKRQVWGMVGLDGYAGPSEVCVVADETTHPPFAAADFLTQIEHAIDNAGFLVCHDLKKLEEIDWAIGQQLKDAPRRSILEAAFQSASIAVQTESLDQSIIAVNQLAPEHLTIATQQPDRVAQQIRHAGCILMGEWSPESAGDFVAGPSHTLPTLRSARFGSPVNVVDFWKIQSLIQLDRDQVTELVPTITAFGAMEGFPAHAFGARVRLAID
jgi:histidinol dehydrogenase